MKRCLALVLPAFVIAGLAVTSSAAMAQQKTAKQCRDEWHANEAANKAKGITEAAYVKDCRAGTTAAQPATPAAPATTPAAAAKKTAKQCRDEWRANEEANKKNGITESAYVKDCRAGTTTAAQPATPSATTPATTPAAAAKKTAKQCRDEWRANEAANKKNGITESAYVKDCRAGTTTAQPANAPATTPAATAPPARAPASAPPSQTAAPAVPPPAQTAAPAPKAAPAHKPAPTTAAAPTGANQFAAEAQAKAHCPSDLVVWVNTDSRIYHFSGHDDYGHTKKGAYMCEKDAMAAGDRAAKNEKHP
jgi:hypothetical protein